MAVVPFLYTHFSILVINLQVGILQLNFFSAWFIILWKISDGQIPALSFQETLAYTTKNNADAVITVGVICGGKTSYIVYGQDGKELPRELHVYEIAPITKIL